MSTTYNRKNTSSLSSIACYTIVSPEQYTTQYFEIIISGSNVNLGGYTYKGCFAIDQQNAYTSVSSVNTLFSYGATPVITFSNSGTTVTVNISTAIGDSLNQNFIASLIAYPTITLSNAFDYSITAI
jgi:hypothetical protein